MRHFLLLLALIPVITISSLANSSTEANPFLQELGLENSDTKLTIFPNPVTGNSFQITSNKEIKSVTTTNMLGQIASTDTNKKSPSHFTVSLNKKISGIYLVTVLYPDSSKEVKRIIVK